MMAAFVELPDHFQDELNAISGACLGEDPGHVGADGRQADAHSRGDLLVPPARQEQSQQLGLLRRQAVPPAYLKPFFFGKHIDMLRQLVYGSLLGTRNARE